jgi:hypothetical protein
MNKAEFETLGLKEASAFLKIHPVTLSTKAASGEIHGAKVGRAWVFLKIDLIAHIRAQYKVRALLSDEGKETICHSTNAKIPLFGGLKSPSLEKQYKEALGLAQKVKPKNSMIGLKPNCGSKRG